MRAEALRRRVRGTKGVREDASACARAPRRRITGERLFLFQRGVCLPSADTSN